jgi:hypothetical protein
LCCGGRVFAVRLGLFAFALLLSETGREAPESA